MKEGEGFISGRNSYSSLLPQIGLIPSFSGNCLGLSQEFYVGELNTPDKKGVELIEEFIDPRS